MGVRVEERMRHLGVVTAVVLGAIAVIGLASPGAARALCPTETAHDYSRPLAGLPGASPLAASRGQVGFGRVARELPFGPRGLILGRSTASPPLVTDSGDVGFKLWFSRRTAHAAPTLMLRWLVTAKLARVDRRGRSRKVPTFSRRRVRTLGMGGGMTPFPLRFRFEPGLYRVEIVFRNGSGRRLHRYAEYFRALPARSNPRLILDGQVLRPGETVSAVAAEYGVGWLSLRDWYRIEALGASGWATAPINSRQLSLLIPAANLGPGEATASPCWSFHIPPGAPPGRYRFVVEGDSYAGSSRRASLGKGNRVSLSSEFEILPAG